MEEGTNPFTPFPVLVLPSVPSLSPIWLEASFFCAGHLQPVLDTLVYLKRQAAVWFEITTLLMPEENDAEAGLEALAQWVVEQLGPDVPRHFTASHPGWKTGGNSPRRRRAWQGRDGSR